MISKKIFACRFEYIMKQGTIKECKCTSKTNSAIMPKRPCTLKEEEEDFKQFLASCHVQQVNNLYVFIIMIFIDSDSYRYLEYFTIH